MLYYALQFSVSKFQHQNNMIHISYLNVMCHVLHLIFSFEECNAVTVIKNLMVNYTLISYKKYNCQSK